MHLERLIWKPQKPARRKKKKENVCLFEVENHKGALYF